MIFFFSVHMIMMYKTFLSSEAILVAVRDFFLQFIIILGVKVSFTNYYSLNYLSNV